VIDGLSDGNREVEYPPRGEAGEMAVSSVAPSTIESEDFEKESEEPDTEDTVPLILRDFGL
jgi:hypothetical protein